MIIDLCHALKLALIHTAVTISFTGNMIFDVFFILVILRELINKCFISTVCSEAFCAYKIYMLHIFLNSFLYSILAFLALFYLNAENRASFQFLATFYP